MPQHTTANLHSMSCRVKPSIHRSTYAPTLTCVHMDWVVTERIRSLPPQQGGRSGPLRPPAAIIRKS